MAVTAAVSRAMGKKPDRLDCMYFAIPRRSHVFVDNSKAKGYYIAAAVIAPDAVTEARRIIRGLRHKNSSSVHFKSEKDAMRKAFLAGAAATEVLTLVYMIRGLPDKEARPVCLNALIDDLCQADAGKLILEQDDSLTKADRADDRRAIAEPQRRRT